MSEEEHYVKFNNYSAKKEMLAKAISFLLRVMLKAIKADTDTWAARLQVVIHVKDGEVVDKYANLVVSTDSLFESDTTVIDRNNVNLVDSDVFSSMIRKIKY